MRLSDLKQEQEDKALILTSIYQLEASISTLANELKKITKTGILIATENAELRMKKTQLKYQLIEHGMKPELAEKKAVQAALNLEIKQKV